MKDEIRLQNENYLQVIAALSTLLQKEVSHIDTEPKNRYGLSVDDEILIKHKIMDCVKSLSL